MEKLILNLVEIIETNSPEHYYEFTKLQMFKKILLFYSKGAVIKLPKCHAKILRMQCIQKSEIMQ